ncbi:MAG: hypothetical protein ACRD03_11255, partial [Acidimicrobiales bacterium]
LGGWVLEHAQHTGEERPGGGPTGQRSIGKADLVAASAQFSWPPAFSSLAVSVQDLMAADTCCSGRKPNSPEASMRTCFDDD